MTDTPSLALRRRRATAPVDAPPIEAFAERALDVDSIPVARTAGVGLAVVFQPAPHLCDPHPEPMDLEAFRIGNQAPPYAAVRLGRAGKAAVFATIVPLGLLAPTLAVAGPPSLPEGEASEEQTPAPSPGEPSTPPEQAPPPSDSGDRNAPNALWEALVGEDLILLKTDQSRIDGRLLGVQNGRLVLARASDGLVVDVDPASVSGIYAPDDEIGPTVEQPGPGAIDPELARKPGIGLMIGGGVLLGFSGTFFVSAAILGLQTGGYYYSYYGSAQAVVPLIVAGVLAAGGGVPMVVIGALRHKKLRKATEERRLRASISPNLNGGWSTSLSLRF